MCYQQTDCLWLMMSSSHFKQSKSKETTKWPQVVDPHLHLSLPPINAFSISILGHSHFNTISQYLSAITALTHSPMH